MKTPTISPAPFPAIPAVLRRNIQTLIPPPNISTSQSLSPLASSTQINSGINTNKMFFLGMGYVAQFFANQLMNQEWWVLLCRDVYGTCSSMKKKKEIEKKGFNVHVFDACQPEWKILDIVRCCTHLLISIPPVESIGDPMLHDEEYLKSRLADGNLQWLCYLSSTGVYGDSKGAWIDEDYSPKPFTNVARMRLKAEEGWLNLGQDLGLSSYVFRLGGIYGPGRSAIDTILKKEPLSEGQKRRSTRTFTSRVHVADICQALRASISMRFQRKIYNIVDDDPASRAEVFAFAQQLIETRWPGLIDPSVYSIDTTITEGGQKRVCNARMKKELGLSLLHPSYRSGLQSIIDQMGDLITY